MTRQLRPEVLERLRLESEAIETALTAHIQRVHADLSNHAANWQPAPMPDDWSGERRVT